MIDDDSFLGMLNKHYPKHSFRITQQGQGRILYVDNAQVKVSWIVNPDILEDFLDDGQKMAIDQEVINAILASVNQIITKKLEVDANRQIPELHRCLCGEEPKLQIDFSQEENTPMVAVKCLCGLRGKAFEVKEAIEAASWWNSLFEINVESQE